MLKDETWMNADDAVKLGFADGKMFDDEDDDEPKNDVVTAENVMRHAGDHHGSSHPAPSDPSDRMPGHHAGIF